MAAWIIVATVLLLAAAAEGQDSLEADLPKPAILSIEPVEGANPGQDGEFVLIRFTQVSGAQGYRIYRELELLHDTDASGALVELPQPVLAWLPFAYVPAVPGVSVLSLEMVEIRGETGHLGVAAEFDEGGEARLSAGLRREFPQGEHALIHYSSALRPN